MKERIIETLKTYPGPTITMSREIAKAVITEIENLETALNLEQAASKGYKNQLAVKGHILKDQEIADLRTLVSIALWIRSEQVAHDGKVIQINDGSLRMELSTQDQQLTQIKAEMDAAIVWYKRLRDLLPDADMIASYRKVMTQLTPGHDDPKTV